MFDWLSSINWGGLLGGLSQLGNLGLNIYGAFNQPKIPQMPQQQMAPPQMPPMPMFTFAFPEMPQPEPFDPFSAGNLKNVARGALGAKSNLQARGVYDGGAVTPEALAALLGIDDPDVVYQALQQYGDIGGGAGNPGGSAAMF